MGETSQLALKAVSDGTTVGFTVANTSDHPALGVKVEWEYEASGSSHPRDTPLKDRITHNFGSHEVLEHRFQYSPTDGALFVLVDAGDGPITLNKVFGDDKQS